MSENMTQLLEKLAAVTAERDHWRANHDNRVRAAKLLTERTDMPMERVGAYKHYMAALEANQKLRERAESAESELLAVREDNHSMMLEIHNLRIERDALAAELAKLRAQEPVAYRIEWPDGLVELAWQADGYDEDYVELRGVPKAVPLGEIPSASPVPAPAVAVHEAGEPIYTTEQARYCLIRFMQRHFADQSFENYISNKLAGDYAWQLAHAIRSLKPAVAVPAGFIPTPFLPDADTLRNDAEFAAQQAATAPSVPDEWVRLLTECSDDPCQCYCCRMKRSSARALLQSADHSEHVLEKVAPDCRACANRGRINGLSQESYCDSCVYQGRDWRQNHFVVATAPTGLLEGGE